MLGLGGAPSRDPTELVAVLLPAMVPVQKVAGSSPRVTSRR